MVLSTERCLRRTRTWAHRHCWSIWRRCGSEQVPCGSHAARRNDSTAINQSMIWLQLALFWSTNTPKFLLFNYLRATKRRGAAGYAAVKVIATLCCPA